MMKFAIHRRLMLLVGLTMLTACVADMDVPTGWLAIEQPTRVDGTRADANYLVSISREGAPVMPATPFSQLATPIALPGGTGYTLLAETCTPTQAENAPDQYGQARYAGTKGFAIQAGTKTRVSVTCTMDNAALRLVEDESFHYTAYEVTATAGNRTVRLTDAGHTAYFNVGDDGQATLTFKVEATDANGKTATSGGTLILKRRTLSRLTLKAGSRGQIGLQVSYDDRFVPGNSAEEEI